MRGGLEAQAGVDDVALQRVGGGHLQRGGGHDGVKLGGAHALLAGGDLLEGLEHRLDILVGEAVAESFHVLHDSGLVVAGGEHDALDGLGDRAGERGCLGAVIAAQACDLAHGALELGHAHLALGVQDVGLGGKDAGEVVERDDAHGVGRGLDDGGARHDAGHGAGVCHVEVVAARDAQVDVLELGRGLVQVGDELGELLGEHGACGIADGDGLGADSHHGLDDLGQVGHVGAGGVDGHELDVVGELGAFRHRLSGVGDQRVALLALDVLHAGGAHGRFHLQTDALRALRGVPNGLDAALVHLDRHGERAILHQRGDGLDAQAVNLGGLDALDLDGANAYTV